MIDVVLAPGRWVLARLKIVQQLLVMSVVLLVPLGAVGRTYLHIAADRRSFSSLERDGVVLLSPSVRLLAAATAARTQAVSGDTPNLDAVNSALSAVERADNDLGATLRTRPLVDTLRTAVKAVEADAVGLEAQPAWDSVVGATVSLIGQVGDGSNLILDPDLDSFYVMDAAVVKVPTLLDAIGQLEALSLASKTDPGPSNARAMTLQAGALDATASGLRVDIDKALAATAMTSVKSTLSGPSGDLTVQLTKLNKEVSAVVDTVLAGKPGRSLDGAPEARQAVDSLGQKLESQLDALLEARIARFDAEVASARRIVIASLLLALYLCLSVARSVSSAIKPMLRSLTDLVNGRFTAVAPRKGRDELSQMSRALSETVDTTHTAIASISSAARLVHGATDRLRTASAELSTAASQSANHAGIASFGIEQLTISIEEIARNSQEASSISSDVEARAATARTDMGQLEASSEGVGNVATVIASIADQTNLLALNATIEAARAGDAGRGFAVVADEVKSLATETANATGGITETVSSMRVLAANTSMRVTEIADMIGQVAANQQTIGAAAEEQSVSARELGSSVHGLVATAEQTSAYAAELSQLAADFAESGDTLLQLITRYDLEPV